MDAKNRQKLELLNSLPNNLRSEFKQWEEATDTLRESSAEMFQSGEISRKQLYNLRLLIQNTLT